MKALTTLIKINKRALDELRRQMVALENQKAQLQQASQKMYDDLMQELKAVSTSPEMTGFYGAFSKRVQKRQEEIAAEIRTLDKKMERLRVDIAAAFSELKKYEIALDNKKQRLREAANRKETIELDEIAAVQFVRKKDAKM